MLSLDARLRNTVMEPSMGCTRNRGRSELCTELSCVKVGPSGFTSRVLRLGWACRLAGLSSLGVGAASSVRRSRCQGGLGPHGSPLHVTPTPHSRPRQPWGG